MIDSRSIWISILFTILATNFVGICSFSLSIQPEFALLDEEERDVTIMCHADTALTKCQFSWQKRQGGSGSIFDYSESRPVLDVSDGFRSHIVRTAFTGEPQQIFSDIQQARYSGRGLEYGDCGVTLTVSNAKFWVVWCRVQSVTKGWKYNWMELVANNFMSNKSIEVAEREVMAYPPKSANLLCRTGESMTSCEFSAPRTHSIKFQEGKEPVYPPGGRHHPHGQGLQAGECGLTIRQPTANDSGFAECYVRRGHEVASRLIMLAITRPASPPVLEKVSQAPDGSQLFRCRVSEGVPAARLSWVLDGRLLREDGEDDAPGETDAPWRRPWEHQPVLQELRLGPGDQGRRLRCIAKQPGGEPASAVIRPQEPPATTVCPLLSSTSTSVSCSFQGRPVNCSGNLGAGVTATITCRPGFTSPHPRKLLSNSTCTEAGTWQPPPYDCLPDCGRRNTNTGETLISGGKIVKSLNEFPWHVAVYELLNNTDYLLICGGSLITPKVVVSAAHCFYDDRLNEKKEASLYRVVAGKLKREWSDPQDPPGVQRRSVADISLPPRYFGREGSYQQDIALLTLDLEVRLSVDVNLICLDWDNQFEWRQLRPGQHGTVAGWGYEEGGSLSEHLRWVDLPFVSYADCFHSLPAGRRRSLTPDKMCAGHVNRSVSTCRGDSGGGLVFESDLGQHYLRGVVSIAFRPPGNSDPCYSQHYTAFTLVSEYRRWITEQV